MARPTDEEVERRAMAALAFIDENKEARTGVARISQRQFAERMGVGETAARTTVRMLIEDGLVERSEQYLPNGGQLENAYLVTARGRRVLRWYSKIFLEA